MNSVFEETLTCNHVYFRYARGKSIAKGNEIHPFHEILFYMDGDATFLSESFHEKLQNNTLLLIPKEKYHNFRIQNQERYTRLVINFPDLPAFAAGLGHALAEIRIIRNPEPYLMQLLERMCRVLVNAEKDISAAVFLYGSFLSLLALLSDCGQKLPPCPQESSTLIAACTAYIDKHFTSPLSVRDIAAATGVSPSALFQCFKKNLGISVHRYITEKRLVYARRLLACGKTPTEIFTACGYSDYSSFFKAYTKMFGHPPSDDKSGP